MNETVRASGAQIKEKAALARERITSVHLRPIGNSPGNVFLISTAYPGVWMEHAFDALCWAQIQGTEEAKKVAEAQMLLFIINRQTDGHLPYKVIDLSIAGPQWQKDTPNGYGQIQECVSFGRLCFETWLLTGNREFLKEAYAALKGWDEWLVNNRMTLGRGLIETFCVYDTGHDNSARFSDIPNGCPDRQGKTYADRPALPIVSPDMNAVFFGDRMALSDMAGALGLETEKQAWINKANEVRDAMFCQLYDKDDDFFYDIDRAGQMRRIKTIAISNVFTEKLLTQAEFDRIYERYMLSPDEFGTPYPFPAVALSDSRGREHAPKNCWGYYSQALTALRAQRWMDFYGRGSDYDRLLDKWMHVIAAQEGPALFTQELDPVTGVPTDCSRWYSSAMLTYLYAVKRLKAE
ncbi:MAG: hypothetical protein J6U72_00245 [Clostridia bacterium]|nr:hypothetical protein [Clostridia bacterium]